MLRTLALTAAVAALAFPAMADEEFGSSFQDQAPPALSETALQDVEPAAGEEAEPKAAAAEESQGTADTGEKPGSVEPAAGAEQAGEEPEAAADEAAVAGEEAGEGEAANEGEAETGEATEY